MTDYYQEEQHRSARRVRELEAKLAAQGEALTQESAKREIAEANLEMTQMNLTNADAKIVALGEALAAAHEALQEIASAKVEAEALSEIARAALASLSNTEAAE